MYLRTRVDYRMQVVDKQHLQDLEETVLPLGSPWEIETGTSSMSYPIIGYLVLRQPLSGKACLSSETGGFVEDLILHAM